MEVSHPSSKIYHGIHNFDLKLMYQGASEIEWPVFHTDEASSKLLIVFQKVFSNLLYNQSYFLNSI